MTEPEPAVDADSAPRGEMGQLYLASGEQVAMRLWRDEQPGEPKPQLARDYETVGYVLSGRATLHIEGRQIPLEQGSSWVVPRGVAHTYELHAVFSAVEATAPPARRQGDRP